MAARVNSSRELVRATRARTQGKTREPTTSMSATNSADLAERERQASATAVRRRRRRRPPARRAARPAPAAAPAPAPSPGPRPPASRPRCARPRSRARPAARGRAAAPRCSPPTAPARTRNRRRRPAPRHAASAPSAVATTICASAPGTAIDLTASRSRSEKCVPTPNISSMTPISASCGARCTSATQPGVCGPRAMPASR